MRTAVALAAFVTVAVAVAASCGGSSASDTAPDASVAHDAGVCRELRWPTRDCDGGCPAGTFCVRETAPERDNEGCAPIPDSCGDAAPSCACMQECCSDPQRHPGCLDFPGYVHCNGPT